MKKYGLVKLPEALVSDDTEYLALCIEELAIKKLTGLQQQLTGMEDIGVNTLKIPNLFEAVHLKKPVGGDFEDVSRYQAINVDVIVIYVDKMVLTFRCRHTGESFLLDLPSQKTLLDGDVNAADNYAPQGIVKFFE